MPSSVAATAEARYIAALSLFGVVVVLLQGRMAARMTVAVTVVRVLTVRSVTRARVFVIVAYAARMRRFVAKVIFTTWIASCVVVSVEEAMLDVAPLCCDVNRAR